MTNREGQMENGKCLIIFACLLHWKLNLQTFSVLSPAFRRLADASNSRLKAGLKTLNEHRDTRAGAWACGLSSIGKIEEF